MGRIIKFRAWDGEKMIYQSKNKEYDDYYMLTLQGDFYAHTRTGDEYFDFYESELNKKKYELMQFTGRTTQKGIDIYEGDIIKCINQNSVVIFGSVTCGFGYHVKLLKWGRIEDKFYRLASKNEIIGNIYENPELIK